MAELLASKVLFSTRDNDLATFCEIESLTSIGQPPQFQKFRNGRFSQQHSGKWRSAFHTRFPDPAPYDSLCLRSGTPTDSPYCSAHLVHPGFNIASHRRIRHQGLARAAEPQSRVLTILLRQCPSMRMDFGTSAQLHEIFWVKNETRDSYGETSAYHGVGMLPGKSGTSHLNSKGAGLCCRCPPDKQRIF